MVFFVILDYCFFFVVGNLSYIEEGDFKFLFFRCLVLSIVYFSYDFLGSNGEITGEVC